MHSTWDSLEVNNSTSLQGKFEQSGSPSLEISICKDLHALPATKYTGVIDTGFTGFIQLPVSEVHMLDLQMPGTTKVTMADNRNVGVRTAMALVILNGQKKSGVVHVSESLPVILLGMDFLRVFHRALIVSKNLGVYVVDEEYMAVTLERTRNAEMSGRV